MGSISLSDANKQREKISKAREKEIRKMYEQLADKVAQEAERLSKDESVSARLKELQLKDLEKSLKEAINETNRKIADDIEQDSTKVTEAVCNDIKKWQESIGLTLEGAFANVPHDIVEMVASGKLYSGKWSLSGAIWSDIQQTQKDINTVIAEGIAANKSAYDIAKDLEKYVNPAARKDWDWSKVYPGTKKVVDYNAQRLARTMVTHAYQQSLVAACAKNPFVEVFVWHTAHSDRVCPICQEREGKEFPKNDLPLDHPNGMCTQEPKIGDLTDISNRLANWANGAPDPELDGWYNSLLDTVNTVGLSKTSPPNFDDTREEWRDMLRNQYEQTYRYKLRDDYWDNAKQWTTAEKSALKKYTGIDYTNINGYLRGTHFNGTGSSMKKLADKISSALQKTPLTQDTMVRRGSDFNSLLYFTGNGDKISDPEWLAKNYKNLIGSMGNDKGFTSCTPISDKGFSAAGVEYRIFCPKGTAAAYIDPLSENEGEEEILIDKDYNFVIRDITYRPEGKTDTSEKLEKAWGNETFIVWCEAVPK